MFQKHNAVKPVLQRRLNDIRYCPRWCLEVSRVDVTSAQKIGYIQPVDIFSLVHVRFFFLLLPTFKLGVSNKIQFQQAFLVSRPSPRGLTFPH